MAIQPSAQPLPVSLGVTPQQPLPVAVTGIKAGPDRDEIRAKVDQPVTGRPGKP